MESENISRSQMAEEPHTTGLSVLVDPENPSVDIVFVHGFTGHLVRSWTCKREVYEDRSESGNDSGKRPSKPRKFNPFTSSRVKGNDARTTVYWPQDLIPITIPKARVLTYGYDTHIRHRLGPATSKNILYDIAWDFLISLEGERHAEPARPVIFIAHSLGGIVVKEALRRSRGCDHHQRHLRSIYEHTTGILFFGTPHSGADPRLFQKVAEKVARTVGYKFNDQIMNSLLPTSERLKELRDEFAPMAHQKKWIIYSFQEEYGVRGLGWDKVVEDVASCLNDPSIEITQHVAHNHTDMCKFSGPNDPEYKKVATALRRILETADQKFLLDNRNIVDTEKRKEYMKSLQFDQIDVRQATIRTAYARTCAWLLEKSEYQDWLTVDKTSEHHGFLWIKGKPGAGKSTIVKFALTNANTSMTNTNIISFFFNARGEQLEKSIVGMFRSLLVQLFKKIPEFQRVFDSLGPRTNDNKWTLETLKMLFGHAVQHLRQRSLTCFIDALDECEEDQVRDMVQFFEGVGNLAAESQVQFRICFSSRHYPHITIEKSIQLILEDQQGHQQDLFNYIHGKLRAGNSPQVEQIKNEVFKRASGIFLWVVLVISILNKEFDRGRMFALRKRLNEIPNGLEELFRDIVTRDYQNMEEMVLCLQWILNSRRPLKCEEFYFAVLSGVGPDTLTAWDPAEVTKQDMERFVLSSSKGLADLTKSEHPTVQFIHESVRDFLLSKNGLDTIQSNLSDNFSGKSHEKLKQCCQNYMQLGIYKYLGSIGFPSAAHFNKKTSFDQLASQKFPFLEYAVYNVLHHADVANKYGFSQKSFVNSFGLAEWIEFSNFFHFQYRNLSQRYAPDASLLYIFTEQGLPHLIQTELERVTEIDILGEYHSFPLHVALAQGNETTLRALLMAGNIIPRRTSYDDTVTCLFNNCQSIINKKDQSVLCWTAKHGKETIVELLLEIGRFNADSRTRDSRTPLSFAAEFGHEIIVKLLLDTDKVNVDLRDSILERTPLSWAARNGHKGVVKLLLETGQIDINSKDHLNRTPLSLAAESGQDAVVSFLLETGQIDIDPKDSDARTPLSWAAMNGHEGIVKLLLETSQVDVNSKDYQGQTPFTWAVNWNCEAVVKLLLEKSHCDVDIKDFAGKTSLSSAATNGYEAIAKLLLKTGRSNVNSKDFSNRTPLSWAAGGGWVGVVGLLLATSEIDVNLKDRYNQTPLSWAVRKGHDSVVKLLLETGQVDISSKDLDGQTPLTLAVGKKNQGIVKLLRQHQQHSSCK